MSNSNIVTVTSVVIAFISAGAAIAAIYFPWRMQKNREILSQAILSLERAYQTLTNNGQSLCPVEANRLNWLTCARHIESYKLFKRKIQTNIHQSFCNEHEEFWRHQIYLALNIPNILNASYYEGTPLRNLGTEPRSAIIIYSFAAWTHKKDPIESVDIEALIKECDPLKGNPGLSFYLESKHPNYHIRNSPQSGA